MGAEEFRVSFRHGIPDEVGQEFAGHRPASAVGAVALNLAVRKAAHRWRCDRIWLHYADGVSMGNYLLGNRSWPVPTEALFLHGRYAYPWSGRARDLLVRTLSRKIISCGQWESLWHLDPLSFQFLKARGVGVASMPEPVEDVSQVDMMTARKHLGLPTDRVLIGVLGSLDSRKGVLGLLRAMERIAVPNLTLAMLGKIDPSISGQVRELVSRARIGSIVVRDEVLGADDFSAAMSACDWQAVVYPRHYGSSGILVRSAAIGRPVLASQFGWIGEATRKYGLGRTCDGTNIESIADQLCEIAKNPSFVLGKPAAAFVNFNTEKNFLAHWTASARTALGHSVDQASQKLIND